MDTSPVLALRKFLAPEIIFGAGALELAGQAMRNLGGHRVLVVSDPGVVAAGWTTPVVQSLEAAGLSAVVFDQVTSNPRDHEIMAGAERFEAAECDALVAVGGGSPIDCAKGIGIVSANRRPVLDFEGVDQIAEPMPPMVCVPTTGGSAADVSQFAIISDPAARRKIAIISKAVVPDVALVDPCTLLTMPPYLTACTGVDALTHAVEAAVSVGASNLTSMHALEAIRLISAHLEAAVANPDDLELRGHLMQASMQAGLAFSNASLGAVHAMAHSLGGVLDLPHGECNALLLEHVIAFNFEEATPQFRRVASAMGLPAESTESAKALQGRLLGRAQELRHRVGIDGALGARGVRTSDVPELASAALRDACIVTNPRRPSQRDVEVIFEEAL